MIRPKDLFRRGTTMPLAVSVSSDAEPGCSAEYLKRRSQPPPPPAVRTVRSSREAGLSAGGGKQRIARPNSPCLDSCRTAGAKRCGETSWRVRVILPPPVVRPTRWRVRGGLSAGPGNARSNRASAERVDHYSLSRQVESRQNGA